MALNAKNVKSSGGGNFVEQEILDPGVYPGRMVQIIDLGLQAQRPYQGKDKAPIGEIMFTYEMVDEFMKDEEGNDLLDKPRWVRESMALHNLKADRAKSTQRYEALDPNMIHDGDFSALGGTPINIALVHNKSGDKTYVNVASIAAMRPRDAEKCPPLVNPVTVFDLDDPDMEIFNALPEWIQTKIKANLNFQGSPLQQALNGGGAKQEPAKEEKKLERKRREEPKKEPEQEEEDTSKVWD